MKKFPKTVAVTWEDVPSDDDRCLVIGVMPEEFAEMGVKKQVAVYRLEKIVTVEGKAEVR